jgi:hypothetical protein
MIRPHGPESRNKEVTDFVSPKTVIVFAAMGQIAIAIMIAILAIRRFR